MKKYALPAVALTALLASGCSYKAPVESVQNINVYSSYEGKIKGTFDLIINVDPGLAKKDIKPTSYICGLHHYPVDVQAPVRSSVYSATEKIFEQVNERTDIPSKESMAAEKKAGYIIVRLKEFEPTISFTPGFFTDTAHASCESGLEVEVRDKNNVKVFENAVNGNRSATGDAGLQCGGGADIMAEAVKKSLRESLERYAERLSNTARLREHFAVK